MWDSTDGCFRVPLMHRLPQHFENNLLEEDVFMSKNCINKTGRHWYNNGIIQVQALECPEGFVLGRLPITEETKKKISETLTGKPSPIKGRPKSEEARRKMSETRKERKIPAWNKGLTASTDERVAKNSEAAHKTRAERGNYVPWNKGLTAGTDERVRINCERRESTMVEKYGVPNPSLRTDIEHVAWNKGLTKETDDRMRKASENHTGVTAWNKGLTAQTDERVHNYIEARRKNNTWNTSQPEEDMYRCLIDMFGADGVVRQCRDKARYPFNCDFYIKSLDLFIELNLHWTHGGKPFDPANEECVALLREWERRSEYSVYYKQAITTWTVQDVKKRGVAHKNNLNYIEIYSKESISRILSGIKEKSLMIKTS